MYLLCRHPFDKLAEMTDDEMKQLLLKIGASQDGSNQSLLNEVVFDDRVNGL